MLRAIAERGAIARTLLADAAGFSRLSGSVTRALHGLREGSSSGAAHPGLITLGLVVVEQLDLDGVKEETVVVTELGKRVAAALGDAPLPKPRDKAASVNRRYADG